MAAFGSGTALWRVDVVLRRAGVTEEQADDVVSRLTTALGTRPTTEDEAIFGDVRVTCSYDMEPPEGSVGVSCWVRSETLGQAAQVGFDTVVAAAAEVTGRVLLLWDLRVVPRSAIVLREDYERGRSFGGNRIISSEPSDRPG